MILNQLNQLVSLRMLDLLQKGYMLDVLNTDADLEYTRKTFLFVKGNDIRTLEVYGGYCLADSTVSYVIETKDSNDITIDELEIRSRKEEKPNA